MKKTIKTILALALALLFNYSLKAQVTAGVTITTGNFSSPTGAVYGTTDYDYPYDIKIDTVSSDGPFAYVLGYTYPGYYIIKYSPAGVFLSSVTLPSPNGLNYRKLAIIPATGGGVYAMAEFYDDTDYRSKMVISKYDKDLFFQTSSTFSPPMYSISPNDMASDGDSLYTCFSTGTFSIVKINKNLISGATYYDPGPDYSSCENLVVDDNSNVYMFGWTNGSPNLMKFTSFPSAPAVAFVTQIPYPKYYLAVNPQTQEVFLAGNNTTCDAAGCRWELGAAKYNASLVFVSSTSFVNPGYGGIAGIAVDTHTNLSIAGPVSNEINQDYGLFIFNSNDLSFKNSFFMDSGDYDDPSEIAVDASSHVYITGRSNRYNGYGYNYDITTARFDLGNAQNRAPSLVWASSTNYWSDGLDPEEGLKNDTFTYRVVYKDPDGDAPALGSVKVKIYTYNNGVEILHSSHTMTCDGLDYRAGILCEFSISTFTQGHYSYKFEAMDNKGLLAKGYPTTEMRGGPQVGEGFDGNTARSYLGLTFSNGSSMNPKALAVYSAPEAGDYVYALVNSNRSPYIAKLSTGTGSANQLINTNDDHIYNDGSDIVTGSDGKVYMINSSGDLVLKKYDKYLVFDSSASHNLGASMNYVAASVDSLDNIYVLGGTGNDMGVAKLDSSLNLLVGKLYSDLLNGIIYNFYPADIAIDPSGNPFVVGYYADGSGKQSIVLAKFDSGLTSVSSVTFTSPGQMGANTPYSVAVDSVTGEAFVLASVNNGQNNNFLILKYNNNLVLQDTAMYDAGNMETPASISAGGGSVYVAGTSNMQTQWYNTYNQMIGLKYDYNLVFKSSYSYGSPYNENNAGSASALSANGTPYLLGYTDTWGYNYGIRRIRAISPLALSVADPGNKANLDITVKNKADGSALAQAEIAVIPFNSNGKTDVSFIDLSTADSNGHSVFSVLKRVSYMVAISTPGYIPSVKDQVMDPYGNFTKTLLANDTTNYFLKTAVSSSNTVRVNVSGVYSGAVLMGEVYYMQTGERVAYGILRATDTFSTMEIYNVPNLSAGSYGIDINIPGWLSTSIYPQTAVPSTYTFTADMTNAMPPSSNYAQTTSTSGIFFSGFIGDTGGNAISGAKVRVYNICNFNGCDFSQESFTDASGRFSMSGIDISTSELSMMITKSGYKACNSPTCDPHMGGPLTVPALNMNFNLAPATYTLTGIVKFMGSPIPFVKVRAYGDSESRYGYDSYSSTNSSVHSQANIGDVIAYTDGDGYFSMPGLDDGNIHLQVEAPIYKNISWGADNKYGTSDDLRITVSSSGANTPDYPQNNPCTAGKAWILDSFGTCKGVAPYVFEIGQGISTNAVVTGNLVFTTTYTVSAVEPLIIARSSAVTIAAYEDCYGECNNRKMFFTTISGTLNSNTTSYNLHVDSAAVYWLNVMSNSWAKLSSFDNDIVFDSTDTIVRNMNLTPAGKLTGIVKKPDGSIYKPASNERTHIEFKGQNVSFDWGDDLKEDGTFGLENMPPGIYDIYMKFNSTSTIYTPARLEGVVVNVGETTNVTLKLETGLYVQPQIYGLPTDIIESTPAWGYHIIAVESGQKMNQKFITDLFFENPQYSFGYSTTTFQWSKLVMPAGQYDFYLVLASMYCTPGDDRCVGENYDQFANFIGKVKNFSVKEDETNANLGTESQPIAINILGALGQTQLSGIVKGSRIFTDSDYERIFANFNSEIMPLIPALMIYDTAGDLRGFAHVLPNQAGLPVLMNGVRNLDKTSIQDSIASREYGYRIWGLPPGRYTAVFSNPNYPPVTKYIPISEEDEYDFNFDEATISIGTITGVVKSSTTPSFPLRNASVYVKGKITEKYLVTDSSGAFTAENLPTGVYKLEISMDGFVKAGKKVSLGKDDALSLGAFYLEPSTSTITGKVLLTKFPNQTTKEGIKVSAYDETLNVTNPQSYLPTIEDLTDETGLFELTGVLPGHDYKVSVVETGKKTYSQTVTASTGATAMGEIVLSDLPPQITVKLRKNADSPRKVDIIIESPKELVNIPVCKYNPGSVYDSNAAVSLALVPGTNNSYVGQFTTSVNNPYYVVYVSVGDATKMEKTVVYDSISNSKTEQYVQDTSLLGGSVYMDEAREEYSGLELDPGSLTQASTTTVDLDDLVGGFFRSLPNVRTMKTDRGDMSISDSIKALMASEVYDIDLSNANPNKSFTLNLKYDKENVVNTGNLSIYQYNSATGSWEQVPGTYSVDPMLGTVSVDVDSIESAYEGATGGATPLSRKAHKMSAIVNGHYAPRSTGSSSQTGKFAVFTAKPGTGTSYTGSAFEIYNMPNPFNLKFKTVTISPDGGSWTTGAYATEGTVIKYHLPSGKSGDVKLVIYNTAGEKVRTLQEGARTGGEIYYSEWDGKNDKNEKCASGVYFLMTYVNGEKAGREPHKMAIIK